MLRSRIQTAKLTLLVWVLEKKKRTIEQSGLSYAPPEVVSGELRLSNQSVSEKSSPSLTDRKPTLQQKDRDIQLPGNSVSAQLSVGSRSIVATVGDSSRVLALDVASGERCWEIELLPPIVKVTSIAYYDGTVYLTALGLSEDTWDTGICLAVDFTSGEQIWTTKFNRPVYDVAVHENGPLVYVAGTVYMLNKSTGERTWKHITTGGANEAPVILDNEVVIGGNHKITSLNLATGAVDWTCGVEGHTIRVRAGENSIYYSSSSIGSNSASVGSLDLNGSLNWDSTFGKSRATAPIVLQDQLLVGLSKPPEGLPGTDEYKQETSEIIAFEQQ
ncbi:PQQ repeat protein (plasmid) [Haloferax gibbonsii]|uniref:PQQ repeat protein n=1 Tax=Haloferax gibbonsii TaxID=35746 RepID=A0A871BL32_HALGI|nr:PQQ-binding-like beta-propeller repeat protein [Haloferax gibbonsii]QOS13490.1 PQQ repeat protein [Haloferax gibbonsii]